MSKVKEIMEKDKELKLAAEFAIMECKMKLSRIIQEQPTAIDAIEAITKYIMED